MVENKIERVKNPRLDIMRCDSQRNTTICGNSWNIMKKDTKEPD